jgi:cell division protein FtsB
MSSPSKIVVFLVVGALLLIIFLPGFIKYRKLAIRNANLKKQIEEVKNNNIRLKQESELLKNDTFYMERVARERMGVAKEGEVVYKIVPPKK